MKNKNIQLYLGKAEKILPQLEDNSVDLINCDPPYGYSFMGKDWDTFNEVKDIQKEFGNTVYAKKGFKKLPRNKPFGMIKFFVPIWKEVLRVLKPGAFAFVMCAPRQDVLSKQIVALQEAGFETGFSSIYWSYATGFPKASNIAKKVDKRLGIKSIKTGNYTPRHSSKAKNKIMNEFISKDYDQQTGKQFETIATSPQAKKLDGSYGGFQPKPAVEIIIVAMKPLSEKTYVDQALKNGKGITWLDNCRVPYENEKDIIPQIRDNKREVNAGKMYRGNSLLESKTKATIGGSKKGRFPANLIVSNDVLNDGKISKSGQNNIRRKEGKFVEHKLGGKDTKQVSYGDSGSYSRYFDLDKWWAERVKQLPPEVKKVFPYLIVPKASKREKNKGCEELENKQQGLEAKNRVWSDKCGNCGLKFIGGEPRCHCSAELKKTDKKGGYQYKNNHPTVKPIKLMSYLITLGSREGEVVLDPFMGSGTTGISAKLLNRKFIGIEMSEEYIKIAKARIEGWKK